MPTLLEAIGNTLRSVYCLAAGPVSTGLSVLGNVYEGLGGEQQGDDLRAAAQLYRNGQQVACNRTPDSIAGEVEPAFQGGQCQGIVYNLTGNFVSSSPPNAPPTSTPVSVSLVGPIRLAPVDDPSGIFIFIRGENEQPQRVWQIDNDNQVAMLEDVQIVRADGGPDDCGSVAPSPPPYNPNDWTSTPTIVYDDDQGNPITVNPTLRIEPNILGPGGELRVPFSFEFAPGISLTGDFDLTTGDINLGPNGADNLPDVSDPQEQPEDYVVDSDNPEVIGVRVIATLTGNSTTSTEILQTDGNPNIYVPRIGNVSFKYSSGSQSSGWGRDIPVKGLNYVIWADRPALDVAGSAEDGWSISLRKIVKKREGCCD